MEKMVFKNVYLNVVVGSLLITAAILGLVFNWIEDYLPIIIGIVLILLSTKRFVFSFKKITSKNATLILVIEFLLDIIVAGLLIYLQNHAELFIGLIVYLRGVSYLIINYVATRKVKLLQYILNIGFVTLGAFFMFYDINSLLILKLFVSIAVMVFGSVLLQKGVVQIVKNEELEEQEVKKGKEKQKLAKIEAKSKKKIDALEEVIQTTEKENKKLEKQVQNATKEKKEVNVPEKKEFSKMTIAELKVLAKERNITGVSQLTKSQIIEKLEFVKKPK